MPFSWHSFIARLRLRAQPRSSPRVINWMRAAFDPAFDEAAIKPVNPIALFWRNILRFIFMFTDLRIEKLHRAESVPRAVASVTPETSYLRESRSLPLAVLIRRCVASVIHRRNANNCFQTAFNIVFSRRPRRDADPHRRAPLPYRSATPAGSVSLDRFDYSPGRLIIAE